MDVVMAVVSPGGWSGARGACPARAGNGIVDRDDDGMGNDDGNTDDRNDDADDTAATRQAMISRATSPWTSVRRKSRPAWR
jgi:hypothetical protein